MNSKILGHRGAKGEKPENTLKGIQYAIDCGVKAIEIDVHKSKDEKLIVIHDDTLERTTDGKGKILDFTLKELKDLDAGEGEKIPTLEEVSDLLINLDIIFFIEIKAENCEEAVAQLIKEKKYYSKTFVKAFNHRILLNIKNINPKIRTQCLMYGLPIDPVSIVSSAKANGLSLSASTIDKQLVEECHNSNILVTTWNANTISEMQKFKDMGVDFIGTDFPSLFSN